jgi:hypothetical protein
MFLKSHFVITKTLLIKDIWRSNRCWTESLQTMNVLELAECRLQQLQRAAVFAFRKQRVFQTVSAGGLSLGKNPAPDRCFSRTGTRRRWLIPVVLLVLAGRVSGEDLSFDFGWQNLEFRTYASNSIQEIADCKVEKIFLDHRELGFFRVKLLPVLVVQGVRLEFAGTNPTNEWAETFQSDWLPKVKRSAVEWRDVDIGSQKAGAPRLHAGRAQPAAGSPTVCVFKDVMVEANGVKWQLPRVELRNEDGCPRLVWKASGGERRLDLFSGEIFNNSKSDGGEK